MRLAYNSEQRHICRVLSCFYYSYLTFDNCAISRRIGFKTDILLEVEEDLLVYSFDVGRDF